MLPAVVDGMISPPDGPGLGTALQPDVLERAGTRVRRTRLEDLCKGAHLNDVVMPEIGVSMDEGTLARWLKQPGDAVSAGEPIAEIETDKAAVELESPVDGVLGRHLVAEGATALVGQALVRVLAPGEREDAAKLRH